MEVLSAKAVRAVGNLAKKATDSFVIAEADQQTIQAADRAIGRVGQELSEFGRKALADELGAAGDVGALRRSLAAAEQAKPVQPPAPEWTVAPYREMPQPRPVGTEAHHGVLDVWARENIENYYWRDAPTVLMKSDPGHNATRVVFNEWRLTIAARQGVSPRDIDWTRVSPGEAWRLAEESFEAAGAPLTVRDQYFKQFNAYLESLRR